MHQGIHSHKIGNLAVAVGLIDFKKFLPLIIPHHKAVLRQQVSHLVRQIKLPQVVHISKIRIHRIRFHAGRSRVFLLLPGPCDQHGPCHSLRQSLVRIALPLLLLYAGGILPPCPGLRNRFFALPVLFLHHAAAI